MACEIIFSPRKGRNMNLEALEQIKQLKARYFRYLDTKQWSLWQEVFCEDVKGDFGPSETEKTGSAEQLVELLSTMLAEATTVHHGHSPEITIINETQAEGIWQMQDIVDHPDFLLEGFGYYHETYKKHLGEWKIASIKLERLKLDFQQK